MGLRKSPAQTMALKSPHRLKFYKQVMETGGRVSGLDGRRLFPHPIRSVLPVIRHGRVRHIGSRPRDLRQATMGETGARIA